MRSSPSRLSVVPLLFLAVFAGALLAPNSREVALMHLRDLNFDTSFKSYTTLYAQGDTSAGVLVPLINLDLHYGKVDDAIALLEAFVKDRPDNIEGRQWLANLYKAAQKPHEYCRVLEDLYRLRPSTATLRDLADTYDFLGAYDQEMTALIRLFEREDYVPREEDATVLATFYRADGKALAAANVMERLVDSQRYAVSLDAVNLGARLWLDLEKPGKAFAIGKAFLQKYPEEASALKLSEVFQAHNELAYAYEILLPFISSGDMSPQLEQQMVSVLLAQGKDELIFNFLRSRFAEGRLPKELATTLVDLSEPRGDVDLMEDVLRSINLNDVPEETLMRYADLSLRFRRGSLARLIEEGLSPARLAEDAPLLGSMLRVAVDPSPENVARLARAPGLDTAPVEARLTVARVFMMNGAWDFAQSLVQRMAIADVLTEMEPMEYASLCLRDSSTWGAAKDKLREALAGDMPPELRAKVELAAYYIDVGSGNGDAVNAYLADHPADAARLDRDTFDLASQFQQQHLAFEAAQRLYARDPAAVNRDRLVDALMALKQYARVLEILEKDAGTKLSDSIAVLSLWAEAQPFGKANGEMQKHVDFVLRRLTPRSKEMRDMAYVLQKAGFRVEAESVLASLAEGQPFAAKDTQELLAYWGPNPPEGALNWVKGRARQAPATEIGAWFGFLNAINKPQIVGELAKARAGSLPAAAVDAYVDALVLMRAPELGQVLAREVDRETDLVRLKKLATVAEQENASIAGDAWQKVYSLDPHDPAALKRIAFRELRTSRFSKARPLLEEYLTSEPDDYEATYAYAEIMRRKDKDAAKPLYDRALAQALETGDESVSMRLAEANLVYRSRGLDESAVLFRKLLEQYPNDKAVRADFVEILLENKRFDDASAILDR